MHEQLQADLLAVLMVAHCEAGSDHWLDTGQLARACGESLYRTRHYLQVLQAQGKISQPGRTPRGRPARWQYCRGIPPNNTE
jgi:hypothetical protein